MHTPLKDRFFENTRIIHNVKTAPKNLLKESKHVVSILYTGSYLVATCHETFYTFYNLLKSFLTIMDNGNDLLTPNSEFSDEKQKIIK